MGKALTTIDPEHTGYGQQASFDDLGTPLATATFVVVDLETTGGAPADAGITEIGAVKVRGGEVVGEFQTLVNPGCPIPPFIVSLTGITDLAVAQAPSVAAAVASFLEFSSGAVLVAHNAPYDTGFLRGACAKHDLTWPKPAVVDTAQVARAALLRDEVPNHKLATLARLAKSGTTPDHRALSDARATVDVLHYLIGRVGDLGVTTVEELAGLSRRVAPERRAKKNLADGLPSGPGVYVFRDQQDRPLYVGTSGNIRKRVLTYFTASEQRRRMTEMVRLSTQVTAVECRTALEAEVRESRLLAAHKPPYNRKSRFPERQAWVKLTVEPFPRLSVSKSPDPAGSSLGPFASRRAALAVIAALHRAFPLRTCTARLPATASGAACLAGALGHCLAPCDGTIDQEGYRRLVERVRSSWHTEFEPAAHALLAGATEQAAKGKYEAAASWRDQLRTLATAVIATQNTMMLARTTELVAARPTPVKTWEIHVIRHGRLAAAGVSPMRGDPRETVAQLQSIAEEVPVRQGAPAADLTEVGAILRWLRLPEVRLVVAEPGLSLPLTSAHRHLAKVSEATQGLVLALPPRLGDLPTRLSRIAL